MNRIQQFLNERAGIRDYANFEYCRKIEEISEQIIKKSVQDNYLFSNGIGYAKYTYTDLHLSWLKQLDIYINNNANFFDAAAMTDDVAVQHGLFVKNNGVIELASIYIDNDHSEDILPVLYHEIMPIYDQLKNDNLWFEDEYVYRNLVDNYNINNYTFKTDVNKISNDDIFNILTECIYYTNYSESHAFMETINFEIYKYLNSGNPKFYKTNDLFMRSSTTLYNILILEYLINNIQKFDYIKKSDIYNQYKADFKKAYHTFNNLDNILVYMNKKLKKMISHSRVLFNYYYNLNSTAKILFEMNDDAKKLRQISFNSYNHKRHF